MELQVLIPDMGNLQHWGRMWPIKLLNAAHQRRTSYNDGNKLISILSYFSCVLRVISIMSLNTVGLQWQIFYYYFILVHFQLRLKHVFFTSHAIHLFQYPMRWLTKTLNPLAPAKSVLSLKFWNPPPKPTSHTVCPPLAYALMILSIYNSVEKQVLGCQLVTKKATWKAEL